MGIQHILLIFLLITGVQFSFSQDTLVLLNGDVRVGKITHSDSLSVMYNYQKGKKSKTRTLSTEIIYSIKIGLNPVQIIYTQGSDYTHQLSVLEMGYYLYGIQDAKSFYRTPWTFWGGVVFNAGVGYLLYDNFLAATGPLAYTVGAGISKVKIKPAINRPVEIMRNSNYQEGYLKVARSKKVYDALTGSLAGLLIGITVGHATN